jgi:hypothetical protein
MEAKMKESIVPGAQPSVVKKKYRGVHILMDFDL